MHAPCRRPVGQTAEMLAPPRPSSSPHANWLGVEQDTRTGGPPARRLRTGAACPASGESLLDGPGGDDDQLVAGVPCLHEERQGDLLVATVGGAAVVEVHDVVGGVDTGHDYGVVTAWVALVVLVLDRLAPDEFGVDADHQC